ncbi:hypothetical protein [Desulforamulus hydrothermalis]|uniref:Uncharacterized protein n=1 Tax=Desulforamulus hydrothermalis Lam5 = DSM 18033 TaxID=1121428 RepID=K8E9P9_9FIRM|nr:hypothetical protein [Desulforamulus hydrothermalis]CCO08308.1 hypothetical protein DESHY_20177 [Desulforamulus hydrothermalis Lam5 = DSM 18033]SHH45689.1 hypothetical protein SAMN02745177_02607 [Desulforamulus hydrothermalis Lam5 = DSM 18033]
MTMSEFSAWAQAKMDQCNVHDEVETSKLIAEIMKKFFAMGKSESDLSEVN